MADPPLLLASASPRRHELLTAAGIAFEATDAAIDEAGVGAGITNPEELVRTLAVAKAEAVDAAPEQRVLAADTVVVHEGTILGKPANRNEARATVLAMSNSTVQVVSAVAMRHGDGEPSVAVTTTTLVVKPLSPAEVHAYVDTGAADDKAGSLAVQDEAAAFITSIDGCYANVVGLPLCSVREMLGTEPKPCPTPESH